MSKKNRVSTINQKNPKAVIRYVGKDNKSLNEAQLKVALEKKLVGMSLKNSKGKVTVELKDK